MSLRFGLCFVGLFGVFDAQASSQVYTPSDGLGSIEALMGIPSSSPSDEVLVERWVRVDGTLTIGKSATASLRIKTPEVNAAVKPLTMRPFSSFRGMEIVSVNNDAVIVRGRDNKLHEISPGSGAWIKVLVLGEAADETLRVLSNYRAMTYVATWNRKLVALTMGFELNLSQTSKASPSI